MSLRLRHLTPKKRPLHQFNSQLMELWGVQDFLLRFDTSRGTTLREGAKIYTIVSEPRTAIYCSHERSPPFAGMEPKLQESRSRGVGTSCRSPPLCGAHGRRLRAEPKIAAYVRSPRSPPTCGAQDRRLRAEPSITTLSVKSRRLFLFHLGNKCSNMGGE